MRKNMILAAVVTFLGSAPAAWGASGYDCSLARTDFGNEKAIDTFKVSPGADALREYPQSDLVAWCQIYEAKVGGQTELQCAVGGSKTNSAAMAKVAAGSKSLTVAYVTDQPLSVYELSCSLPESAQ